MSEEILINSTPSETRVALVENGMLQEVWLERASQTGYIGNIYRGQVSRVLPGLQAAFIEIGLERTAFLHARDMVRQDPLAVGDSPPDEPQIQDLLRQDDEVTVQVIKDPLGSKGARLTTNISIPSRFLVLLPDSDVIGISARIEEEAERSRLKDLVRTLRSDADSHGYIVRTNAEGVNDFALSADMVYLGKVWQAIRDRSVTAEPASCVFEDLSLSLRALRDMMHEDVDRVRIDSTPAFEKITDFARRFVPDWLDRIEEYTAERPIFDLFGVEDEIENALKPTVPLKSGGYLVFDQTEAMTTIDVNTGGFVGYRNLEETIYKTNLEAAQAIGRQLRLRNLGGIIIIDYIDMNDEEHRRQLLSSFERALARDHAKTTLTEISTLGLIEMTRKRTTESLERRLCVPCPYCDGRGTIKSTETVCLEIFREIMRSSRQFEASKLMVVASSRVVERILDEQSATVAELEELIGKSIRFQREDQYAQDQYDVVLL
ncbi:MAG: ribonuclease G [Xanthomonadales bacterium]|nr:ribonuclease G [Gammaproteobacteria bacterium]MBT8054493.1 ribonuclease G [Gammaproteobacteria bacterium]NND57708.1 ribonuclease G [Xanthomonadales bacterium]NNK52621.1 ribonuclease G [Xanthomonadales bacterium]